jgi:hypothetical protein
MRQALIVALCSALLLLAGCAWLDRITGADGKSGGPGQPKSTLQVIEEGVGTAPLYGGLVSGILGIFGTVYNGIRAKRLGTEAAVAQQQADEKGKMLLSVIDGVEDVKAKLKSGEYAEAINDLLRAKAAAYQVYEQINAEVRAFRGQAA